MEEDNLPFTQVFHEGERRGVLFIFIRHKQLNMDGQKDSQAGSQKEKKTVQKIPCIALPKLPR